MLDITVKDIVKAVEGTLLCGDENQVIEHLSIDSRSSEGNDLFIPIIGAKVDAHRFIENAFQAGCVATLTSEHTEMNDATHPWIAVKDTILALHEIGRLCRTKIHVPAIGVTGSVGKTTTREMISYALSAGKKVYKTQKNYNSSVGLPITLSLMSNDYDVAVLELGMNVPGELGTISELARLDMAVLTNVGVAHIEYFGSREAICEEKYTITRGFHDGKGLLFINGDDPLLYQMRESTGYPYLLYGTEAHCDYRAEQIEMKNGHYCFVFVHGDVRIPVTLSVLGHHNVVNAVAALAVADQCQVDLKAAAEALSKFEGFTGRLQTFTVNGYTVIDDTYNASPASMVAGMEVLSSYETSGRKVAVLSDMLELGSDSAKFHHEVGEAIASAAIDELIIVGHGMAENITAGVKEKHASYVITSVEDNEAAAQYLREILHENDVVYLKASNSMKLKEIVAQLKPV